MNKMTKSTVVFSLFILVLWAVTPTVLHAAPDSAGTEFYLAFQPNEPNWTWATNRSISLFITGKHDTQGSVTIPGLNFTQTFSIQANQTTTIPIPLGAQNLGENSITKLAVHITAQSEVTVFGLNRFQGSADAFLAIPVDALGLEYLAMSYPGYSGTYPSQVAVVGAYDNTKVTITPAGAANGHPAGVPFSVVLNKGDVYQIRASGVADLTGTSVTSTAPVAVMSGDDAVNVPFEVPGVDQLAEMLPPVASWGRSFFTVPLATRYNGDTFRILASQDGTEVRINGTIVATLNRGKFLERIWDSSAVIEASAPILVAQYSNGWYFEERDDLDVGPAMMLIVPTEQFLNQYTIYSPATGYATHFINVTVPTASIPSLMLDGAPLNESYFKDIGTSGFSGAQVPISAGSHTISGNVPFGIYAYGYASGYGESYAYPGGMAVKFINPTGDTFPPNLNLTQVGDTVQGIAMDNEDSNANGILDNGEDLNSNGVIEKRSEDLNGNGVLDIGEDLNENGILDQDTGIFRVELEDGASNLKLDVLPFIPGASTVYITSTLLDPKMPGSGMLWVTDGVGNATKSQISISGSASILKNVRLMDTISTNNIDIDLTSFLITPYSVTTTADRTIVEWRFDTFQSDAMQDLSFDIILKNPVAGEQRLVSHKLEVLYTDINGNPVRNEIDPHYVQVLTSKYASSLTMDRQSYWAKENVLINARISNLSPFPRSLDAKIRIEDSAGVTVQEVTSLSGLQFAAGETKDFNNLVFNTDTNYAGSYRARLLLYEGQNQAGTALTDFVIAPGIAVSCGIVADKVTYKPNEQVALSSTVTSLSVNSNIENLTTKVTIVKQSPTGDVQLYTETKSVPSLMPGASAAFRSYWNTGVKPAGTYLVTLQILDAAGAIISSSTRDLTIGSTTEPTTLLKGQISLDKQSILTGEPVTVSYSVMNAGNLDLSNIALSVWTINLSQETVYNTISDQATIAMGATYTNSNYIDTQNYSAMDYLVVLRATIGGVEETLAGTYFRIEGAPSAPALVSPGNGTDVETFTPTLTVSNAADPNDDKITYEFEIYTDSGLMNLVTSGAVPETAGSTAWVISTPLTENQTFHWRARAFDGRLYSSWMASASFRVNTVNDPPPAPTVSSPADASSVATLTPALTVNNSADPDSANLTYNFDLALDPDFIQIVASSKGVTSGQSATSWTVPISLQENGSYYWRAQADDWFIESPWSASTRFFVNTANDAPSTPFVTTPISGSTVTVLTTDIVVTNSTDPDSTTLSYYFEADTLPTFDSTGIIRSGNVAEGHETTLWHPSGLQDNTQYYIRVRASDGTTDSPWSAVTEFFANAANDPPTTPILANPSNWSGVNVFTPTLSVHNSTDPDRDVLTYEFEIYSDAALINLVAQSGSIAEATLVTAWTTPAALTENQTYYWRAWASDGSLRSAWMQTASFMVNTANDAPGAPQLSAPADGKSLATLSPTLTVANAVDPDSDTLTYGFEIYFGTTLAASISGVTSNSQGFTSWSPGSPLNDNTVYQWRARAYDGDRYGQWMNMATFTTHIQATSIRAEIEFEPETLNKESEGKWVMVEIELPHGYKASNIDISSIRLEGTVRAETWSYEIKGRHYRHGCEHERKQHEHAKLRVKFRRSDVIAVLPEGERVPVHVTGKVGTAQFEGVDLIRVIKSHSGHGECR